MAPPSSDDEKKTVRLRGKDGEPVEVPEKSIAAASAMVKGMIDEGCAAAAAGVVVLPSLSAAALSRVAEYVKKHFKDGAAAPEHDPDFYIPDDDGPLARFDDELVRVDHDALIDLIEAANFLGIDGLLDLTCKAVAEQMKGKPIVEIRKKFNIVNDYTEEEVRRENSWAFE